MLLGDGVYGKHRLCPLAVYLPPVPIFFKMACFILDGNVFMNYTFCIKQVF
jgi:hypothetical protein